MSENFNYEYYQENLNWSKLHFLAKNSRNKTEIIQSFQQENNINVQDNNGHTALHIAVIFRNAIFLTEAIKAQAKLDIGDNYGITALQLAAGTHNNFAALKLIKAGANLHIHDQDGCNLLHICCFTNNAQLLQNIINKFDIEAIDNYGNTPLLLACMRGSIKSAIMLINHKAKPNHKNIFGYSAQDLIDNLKIQL